MLLNKVLDTLCVTFYLVSLIPCSKNSTWYYISFSLKAHYVPGHSTDLSDLSSVSVQFYSNQKYCQVKIIPYVH